MFLERVWAVGGCSAFSVPNLYAWISCSHGNGACYSGCFGPLQKGGGEAKKAAAKKAEAKKAPKPKNLKKAVRPKRSQKGRRLCFFRSSQKVFMPPFHPVKGSIFGQDTALIRPLRWEQESRDLPFGIT